MNGTADVADAELRQALGGRRLVTFDRFTSAGRSSILGPVAIPTAQPVIAVGYYRSWSAVGDRVCLAAEERTGRRDPRAKHTWLADLGASVQQAFGRLGGQAAFAAWYADAALQRLADAVDGVILTVPAMVRLVLEDKTRLDDLLRAAGAATALRIPAESVQTAPPFAEVTARLGPALVVQPSHTSGGRGTVFVRDAAAYQEAVLGPGPWRISTYVDGFSSNTTVLTVPTAGGCKVYVDIPSHKAVGVTELGIAAAKGAGNDWSPTWPHGLTAQLVEAVADLGLHLFERYGLVGLWGVDTIWGADRVVINEINVRNQGTTELSGVNQALRGLPPFLVAHLTILAGGRVSWLPPADEFNAATISGTVTGGSRPFYLKLRNFLPCPVTPDAGWRGPGVYRLAHGDAFVWSRAGAHPMDANLDQGEVLLANAPTYGVVCLPGAELGTVEGLTTRPIFDGPSSLSTLGQRLRHAALALLTPCDLPGRR
jgi:hypothetical protein